MTPSVATDEAARWLARIHEQAPTARFRIMNVCGGHERALTMAGLRTILPAAIELIPGPGCPVCICPEEDLHAAIELAQRPGITLVAFGDLLRVPANAVKGRARSLAEARAAGADVRPIAAPQEATAIARALPARQVVFFATGFETTTAPVAATLLQGVPPNLSVLLSGRRTWPAVAMLLDSGTANIDSGIDALIAPGHVATVMGPEEWSFVPERHGLPTAVAGFTPVSLLAAVYSVLRQAREGRCFVDNAYAESVRPGGNPGARRCLEQVMEIVDANWRGIGVIPASGYALRTTWSALDARRLYDSDMQRSRRRAGEMPPGCDCARVVLGRIAPNECALYGRACTPRAPVGPCMVSDEGACRIWWAGGIRAPQGRRRAKTEI
jgi:hydrogenase expression/formation protein HypD